MVTQGQLFLDRARYFLGTEYRTQLRLAVDTLTDEGVWWRAHEQSNSVGNLLLHLNGNVRQWILGGVGRQPDARHRAEEFAAGVDRREPCWLPTSNARWTKWIACWPA